MSSIIFAYKNMSENRYNSIDFLRGIAVILMIFIHTSSYYQDNKLVYFFWNYTHFVVPLFVFCSSYIAFIRNPKLMFSLHTALNRIMRLIVPYYIYMSLFFFMAFFVFGKNITTQYVLNQLFLGNGRDTGWLVVLFIYILFLIPIIQYIGKRGIISLFVIGIIFASTILFLFVPNIASFRGIMWLPWSAFVLNVYYFVKNQNNSKKIIQIIIVQFLLLVVSALVLIFTNKSFVLIDNKYPPNLFYLSYGAFLTSVLFFAHKILISKIVIANHLQKIFRFLSANSYSLFFIHLLLINTSRYFFMYLNFVQFFLGVFIFTIATQIALNKSTKLLAN